MNHLVIQERDTGGVILHFSGSGNSRMVADSLAARLGATVRPLMEEGNGAGLSAGALVGIVFPVHFMQAPPVVLRRIGELDLAGRAVFLVASSGGEAGDALGQAGDAVRRRGGRIVACLHAPVADNSVMLRTAAARRAAWRAALPERLDGLVDQLRAAAQAGSQSVEGELPGERRPVWWRLSGGLLRAGMRVAYGLDRKRVDEGACTGCGACLRACPVGNLTLAARGGREVAAFGADCADCFGCLHACPRAAISFGRIRVAPETRYRAPDPV